MDLKEFRVIIASYIIESNSVIRNREASMKKFFNDAKEYKKVNVYFELDCIEPKLQKEVQYYHFDCDQLISYFSYRTSIRKKQVPKNNYAAFLQLYLIEILSGLYSNEYEDVLRILNYLENNTPNKNQFLNLLKAAYEILYLQYYKLLENSNYIENLNISILENKEIVYKNGEWVSPVCFVLFNIFNLDSFSKYNNNSKFIFSKCFEYIYYKLKEERFVFNTNDYLNIEFERFFENIIHETNYTPYENLITFSKRDINIALIDNKKKKIDYFIDGVHKNIDVHFRYEFNSYIKQFAIILFDSIYNQCGGVKLPVYSNTKYDSYNLKVKNIEINRIQKKLNELVASWIVDNNYARKGFNLPYKEFISFYNTKDDIIENVVPFFNMDEIDKVRIESRNIQEKLIVEEIDFNVNELVCCSETEEKDCVLDNLYDEIAPILINEESTIINNSDVCDIENDTLIEDGNSNLSIFKQLFNQLTQSEQVILEFYLNDRIDEASQYLMQSGEMLSIVVDSINTKSDEIIEDIIIESNEIVEDYKDELLNLYNQN